MPALRGSLPSPEAQALPARLPALAFGHAHATACSHPRELDALLGRALGLRAEHEEVLPEAGFCARATALALDGLRILALASPPVQVRVTGSTHPVVVVPLHGVLSGEADGRAAYAHAQETALLLTQGAVTLHLRAHSSLWLAPEPDRLARAAEAAGAGEELGRAMAQFQGAAPATLPLRVGRARIGNVLRHLCRLLDEYGLDAELLRLSGCGESFCRALVTMLVPGRFLEHAPADAAPSPGASARLDAVCDHVLNHLDERVTLQDMQRVSGLSARSLQYAFRRRFGCTPQGWVLEQRLQAARAELALGREGASVTQVAVRYFSNLGRFAAQYRSRFGELPTITLARARSPRGQV